MTSPPRAPSSVSRSTPRVRLMALAVLACVLAVAVSERPTFTGAWGTLLAAAGFALVVVAALGRLWTSLFIAGSKDSSLVRVGPYAACRHPLYALSLIGMLGLGLCTRSVVLLLALTSVAALLHARALQDEDRLLESIHGDAARQYRASVPALWPDRSQYVVPAALEIRPPVVWKAFLDAGSLLLAFALVDVAHLLQRAGSWPPWFVLP